MIPAGAALLLTMLTSHADALANAANSIQIAIVRQAASALISPEGNVRIVEPNGKTKSLEWKGNLRLTARFGGLRLSQLDLPSDTRLEPQSNALIKVGPDLHGGTLILRLDSGQTVSVIEEVDIEKYLEGVLPQEMDSDWPVEALKAQAVVARSFAYANLGRFKKEGFDLTSDTRSQVYRGLTAISPKVRLAVRETRGEVLGWQGRLLRVYYHACCGGHTENAGRAWGDDPKTTPKPLRGVRDPWCSASPEMRWTAFFSWQDIMNAVEQRYRLPAPLKSLGISERDVAGYVQSFVARAGKAKFFVKAAELRSALGATDLKSARISRIVSMSKGLEFVGTGAGHGVGLCQWGSKIQAQKGRTYEQILHFYFPGSDLSVVVP